MHQALISGDFFLSVVGIIIILVLLIALFIGASFAFGAFFNEAKDYFEMMRLKEEKKQQKLLEYKRKQDNVVSSQ